MSTKAEVSDEERYRLLVDSITDYAIYMLDPEGKVASWNTGAERVKGYRASEILGRNFAEFYPPEDRAAGKPQRALSLAAANGRFESEGWRIRKDGTRFWAHVVIDPIPGPDGTPIGFAKITRDLTERKSAEEQLRKSEQQFRILVQGVTDYAIYMMDPDGQVSSWNAGAQRIKGYAPSEIIGQHYSRFFGDDDRAMRMPERALEMARREGRFEVEGWRFRKDGTRFWANAVIDAIRDERGELIGFAKVTRDITEKREAQKALEIAREELFQAQKMEAMGQLTGGIAHDFNNLLMAIQGSLELLKKKVPLGPDAERLLKNALQATRRGASLTQRMLAFSRRQDLQFESVDVIDLIRGMTDLLQRSIGPMIVIETRFPLTLPNVWTDPNQLASAILNLVLNARDAMPRGGRLEIGAQAETDPRASHADLVGDRYVRLWVRDEGEGMTPEILDQALTPFFTTKGVGKGTGLGLPMVQGLMGQSKGKLVLRSRPDEGTVAELWLPVPEQELPASLKPESFEMPKPEGSLTILAVDDDPLVLMNTVLMLEDLGHRVLEAGSGRQALELAADQSVDLVVTDQAMPHMTGVELIREIRKRHPDMPVVLATGYADLPDGAGKDVQSLGKPFMQAQLAEAVAKALAK